MSRIDYYDDPQAPRANSLVAATSAIVADGLGRFVLHRRADNQQWALPGGGMELGESITDTTIREVREETGLEVEPRYIVGVYSDPRHVFAYDDGEVRQEYSVCIACNLVRGTIRISDESLELAFVTPQECEELPMHPRIRARVRDYVNDERGALR